MTELPKWGQQADEARTKIDKMRNSIKSSDRVWAQLAGAIVESPDHITIKQFRAFAKAQREGLSLTEIVESITTARSWVVASREYRKLLPNQPFD